VFTKFAILYQVGARPKSKRRRSSTINKTPILPSIGGISVVKKDEESMSRVREELTKSANIEKSPDEPLLAVKSEEAKVVRVNARQLKTLFGETMSQRKQTASWGGLRSRLTNASFRGALTAAKVKNDARSKI
jgi:hypothetical protein